MNSKFLNRSINAKALFAILVFYSCPVLLCFVDFNPVYLIILVFNFIWFGLSSSMYYHRILAHKSGKLNLVVEIFFLLGGVISLSGSPISWTAIHRYHHAIPDTENDPHSPRKGRFWAYMGWLFFQDLKFNFELKHKMAGDLIKRRLYRMFDHKFVIVVPSLVYILAIYHFFGAGGIVWGYLLAGFLSFNFHWMLIASFCHDTRLGYRLYDTPDYSRNVPWLSFLSFGESLHNNHHHSPSSFKFSQRIWEFDFSFYIVKILEKLNLAKDVR